jgi:hypothetical protein
MVTAPASAGALALAAGLAPGLPPGAAALGDAPPPQAANSRPTATSATNKRNGAVRGRVAIECPPLLPILAGLLDASSGKTVCRALPPGIGTLVP